MVERLIRRRSKTIAEYVETSTSLVVEEQVQGKSLRLGVKVVEDQRTLEGL